MVDAATEEEVRNLRSKEQWLRYDSVVIGPGARDADPGWFNTFAEFANADRILFNTGSRSRAVGLEYSNQQSEREDFAQDIYQTGIEFHAPPGILDTESQALDATVMPLLWVTELPNRSSFRITMADTDTIAIIPGIHAPAAVGTSQVATDDSSSNVTIGGQTGTADLRNSWTWPEPVKIPAKGQFAVELRLGEPIRQTLQGLTNTPGTKTLIESLPNLQVNQVEYPNWYFIRVWHRGPRYVQLRGARSS